MRNVGHSTGIYRALAALALAAPLLAGCNNEPNTHPSVGPSVQMNLVGMNGVTWPAGTGSSNTTGWSGTATPAGRSLLVTALPKVNTGNNQPFILWDPQNSNPVYDFLVTITPGDSSGIRQFFVGGVFESGCNGQGATAQASLPSTSQGTPTGPVLTNNPTYVVEISNTVSAGFPCVLPNGGGNAPGAPVGNYQFTVNTVNGNGKTSQYTFLFHAGKTGIPNNYNG